MLIDVKQSQIFYLECPCTGFPRSFARDYKETYLYPPPSTIYGFLLSLVGEEDLTKHLGVKLAIGVIVNVSPISRILRKQRHHKFSKQHKESYLSQQFSKPNFQELLTDLKVAIKIDSGEESAFVKLHERVTLALSTPEQIKRYGGLSLGESWALINGIREYRLTDGDIQWLVKDNRGLIGLPVWIDRQTTQGVFQRFTLNKSSDFNDACWAEIKAPLTGKTAKSRSKKSRADKA